MNTYLQHIKYNAMLDSLISLYAPRQCLGCQAEGSLLCRPCSDSLTAAARCYHCRALSSAGRTCSSCRRRSGLYAVQVVAKYQDLGKELVGRLKFAGAKDAASVMATTMSLLSLPKNAVIIPVPTATGRIRLRGYDQAALLAKQVARLTKSDYHPCLLRIGQHRQVGATRAERLAQMQQSFLVKNSKFVQGRRIVLIDDVMTTGATLESAAQILKLAGAKRVEAVVFARA